MRLLYPAVKRYEAIWMSPPLAAKWIQVHAIGRSRRESLYAASWPEYDKALLGQSALLPENDLWSMITKPLAVSSNREICPKMNDFQRWHCEGAKRGNV
jgi:hypothetical protein